jgi:hypothetical protein
MPTLHRAAKPIAVSSFLEVVCLEVMWDRLAESNKSAGKSKAAAKFVSTMALSLRNSM